MPFNGSGVFVRLYNWVSDRDNGVKILASKMDDEMDGFAAGLTSVNAHASATGNPHGTTAANIGAAPTANPTFTGTINGAILALSGALTAASGAFSGALSAATATIASVLTVGRISITENTAQDITLASTNNPIQLGSETGRNVVLDTNDVQFRDNGAAATGRFNPLGGDLVLGASTATVSVNGTLDVNRLNKNQTWQDVSGSRVAGTYYQNTTGKPISVNIVCEATSPGAGAVRVSATNSGGIIVGAPGDSSSPNTVTFEVPPDQYYSLSSGGVTTFSAWAELR